jgi:hypothetical protein
MAPLNRNLGQDQLGAVEERARSAIVPAGEVRGFGRRPRGFVQFSGTKHAVGEVRESDAAAKPVFRSVAGLHQELIQNGRHLGGLLPIYLLDRLTVGGDTGRSSEGIVEVGRPATDSRGEQHDCANQESPNPRLRPSGSPGPDRLVVIKSMTLQSTDSIATRPASPGVRHRRTQAENQIVAAFRKVHAPILSLTEENLHSPQVILDILKPQINVSS